MLYRFVGGPADVMILDVEEDCDEVIHSTSCASIRVPFTWEGQPQPQYESPFIYRRREIRVDGIYKRSEFHLVE